MSPRARTRCILSLSVGTYAVSLGVSNTAGSNTTTMPGYITVTNSVPLPITSFTADIQSGTAPLTVQFTDTSGNSPTGWQWSFGDGITEYRREPFVYLHNCRDLFSQPDRSKRGWPQHYHHARGISRFWHPSLRLHRLRSSLPSPTISTSAINPTETLAGTTAPPAAGEGITFVGTAPYRSRGSGTR